MQDKFENFLNPILLTKYFWKSTADDLDKPVTGNLEKWKLWC